MNIVSQDTIRSIPLTQGLYAIVEAEDYPAISKHKWYAKRDRNNWYAVRRSPDGGTIQMHVELLGRLDGYMTDHRNGFGLDNRRENLRICTCSQNSQNRRRQKVKRTSKYKGVSYKKSARKWVARICVNGKSLWLGYFMTAVEAAQAYDLAAIEHFGTFARINEYSREELENGQI